MATAITFRISPQEDTLIKSFAKLYDISVSEFARQTIMERIENEIDLRAYKKAMKAYKEDPVVYSHDEVVRMMENEP